MKPVGKLSWILRRMSIMSVPELAHRLTTVLSGALGTTPGRTSAATLLAEQGMVAEFLRKGDSRPLLFKPSCATSDVEEVHLLRGEVPVFGAWVPVGSDPAFWHTDPFSSAVWPRQPGWKIDYRPGNPTGDVRIVWELNRLQHLFGLALIAAKDDGRRAEALRVLESHLLAWSRANPPGEGVNYLSAMEEALRLVAVLHAYALVHRWASDEFRSVVAGLVVYHARHVERRVSQYSSAGNHTIAEAVGLLYAGTLLKEHPRAVAWQRSGLTHLRREAARQVDSDGGGLEQATWYLLFITDLLGLAQALLAHAGLAAEPQLDAALRRVRQFLNTVATGPEDLPKVGDADDGFALWRSLRISWADRARGPHQVSYRASGLSLVRYGESDRLVFLHGPLGMAPAYAHGHADSLSVLFRWEGSEVLIDPGTYQYGGQLQYRQYFRSTTAHNTVTVDSADQAEQLTAFMWRKPFNTDLLLSRFDSNCSWLFASHDGYQSRGVVHRRGIIYRERQFLAVWDSFEGSGVAKVALHWHLGCSIGAINHSLRQAELRLASGRAIRFEVSDGFPTHVRGSLDPLLGWRSDHYGELEPCDVLKVTFGSVPTRPILTVFWLDEPGRLSDIWLLCVPFDRAHET